MATRLADHHYAVFDVETTGFDPADGDTIIEIAVARIDADGRRLAELSTLVNPGRDVGPTDVHRISNDMVAHAPTFAAIQGHVCDLMHNAVVVAHNATFDRAFLAAALAGGGVTADTLPVLCTLRLTDQLLLDRTPDRKLATLAGMFGLPLDGAYADVRATASLLTGYLHIAERRGLQLDDLARSFVAGTDDVVNRDEVGRLLTEPYPARPDDATLARYHPPADPVAAVAWQAKLDRYRQQATCPQCGDGVVRQQTRRRDHKPFRSCTNWADTGCDYTAELPAAAA